MSTGNVTVKCPFCGRQSRMPPGAAGKTVRCPHCGQMWKLTAVTQEIPLAGTRDQRQQTSPNKLPTGADAVSEEIVADLVSQNAGGLHVRAAPSEVPAQSNISGAPHLTPTTGTGPASSLWWFVLGGLSVLVLLGVLAAVVTVVVLLMQKPAPQPTPPQAPMITAEPAPPPPDPMEELNRKGAATAAFLEALFNESHKVMGDFSNINALFAGGAPGDIDQRMRTFEQALARLQTQDVDPVAIRFKDNYARELKKFMTVAANTSQNLNVALQSGNPEAMLNQAEQLAAARNEMLAATNNFFAFLNTEGQAVKQDLESRYHRSFPMPALPR
ncbi:MAG: hypothetical protein ACUVQR_06840 [Thermogutta sp.]